MSKSAAPGGSIHRMLAARMALAAAVTSIIVGALAVVVEQQSIGETAVDRAVAGSTALMALVEEGRDASGRLDAALVQSALERLKTNAAVQKNGRFVSARVYDTDRRRVAQIEERDHPAFSSPDAGALPGDAASNRASYMYSKVKGIPVVSVVVPILPRSGQPLGWISGVFAVSDEAVAEATARIVRRVLISVAIVLATVLVVYPIIARLVERLRRAGHRLLDSNLDSIAALGSAIAKKDSDTDVHNYRVTIYAARLGEAVGLDRRGMCALMKGAFLHDVGKIGIKDAILLKPGRLDDAEFTEMKKHVEHGIEIVRQSDWLKDAADIVGGHHEKFDGSGYPAGLRGDAIPINARIFALADVFDALTSRRPYKTPMTYAAAMTILETGRGSHFDPRLLDRFSAIARPLFDEFGNRDDEGPRAALRSLIDQYFKGDAAILLA